MVARSQRIKHHVQVKEMMAGDRRFSVGTTVSKSELYRVCSICAASSLVALAPLSAGDEDEEEVVPGGGW